MCWPSTRVKALLTCKQSILWQAGNTAIVATSLLSCAACYAGVTSSSHHSDLLQAPLTDQVCFDMIAELAHRLLLWVAWVAEVVTNPLQITFTLHVRLDQQPLGRKTRHSCEEQACIISTVSISHACSLMLLSTLKGTCLGLQSSWLHAAPDELWKAV